MPTATDSSAFRREVETTSVIPALQSGDRLTAEEFERRYRAMPGLKKAELIEGIVYVASPVSDAHARCHSELHLWLALYRAGTPGTICSIDGTVRLDSGNRPQPDIHLRIDERLGGQAHVGPDGYVEGAPELVAEVAYSSVSNDLHDKLNVYRRNGVREYVVWRVEDEAIDWFVLRDGAYQRLEPAESVYRSTVFPGLRLDPAAMLRGDSPAMIATVQHGLESPEHAAFVARLAEKATATARTPKVEDQSS